MNLNSIRIIMPNLFCGKVTPAMILNANIDINACFTAKQYNNKNKRKFKYALQASMKNSFPERPFARPLLKELGNGNFNIRICRFQ